jgi:hypothetical protein
MANLSPALKKGGIKEVVRLLPNAIESSQDQVVSD